MELHTVQHFPPFPDSHLHFSQILTSFALCVFPQIPGFRIFSVQRYKHWWLLLTPAGEPPRVSQEIEGVMWSGILLRFRAPKPLISGPGVAKQPVPLSIVSLEN